MYKWIDESHLHTSEELCTSWETDIKIIGNVNKGPSPDGFPMHSAKNNVYEMYYWLEDQIVVIGWCSIIFHLTHMHDQTIKSAM